MRYSWRWGLDVRIIIYPAFVIVGGAVHVAGDVVAEGSFIDVLSNMEESIVATRMMPIH
jgi:hypothetical protein